MKSYKLIIVSCAVLFFVAYHSPCFGVDFKKQAQEYREKGYNAQERGDIQSAITFYQKAISLVSNYAAAYNDLGIAYETLGELDLAEENYLKVISLDKYYLSSYTNLAYFYEKTGELKKAAFFWKKRIELGDPQDYWTKKAKDNFANLLDISEELRMMFINEEIDKLNEEVRQQKIALFEMKTAESKKHLELGKKYLDEARYTEASEEFQKASALTPDNPTILDYYRKAKKNEIDEKVKLRIRHGLNYYELGDMGQAREEFKDLLTVIPDK